MRDQNFGIEIELTGLTRKKAAEIMAVHFGTRAYYSGDGYDAYHAKDQTGRIWKAMSDGSIYEERGESVEPRDEEILNMYERRYHQEEMTVNLNGKPTDAMIYMMDDGYHLSPPHSQYYNTILQGYKAAGFDRQILDAAVHESAVRFEEMPEPEPEPEPEQLRMDDMQWWKGW